MRAAQISAYGGQDALAINNDAPKPVAGDGEVLVEVQAVSTNPFDYKVRDGIYQEFIKLKLPATLGGDVAGVVAEVGPGVTGFEAGQEVYGQANAAGGRGSYAEFTPVKASQLAAKPGSVDFVTAAALPLTAVSAYQAVVDTIQLRPDQKILIHGGAGGIGTLAIQIAKNIGAHVATTASAADADYVKGLGADEVIDYNDQDFSQLIKGYDAVFDTVGGDTNKKSYEVLKSGGTLVSMVEQADDELAKQRGINYVYQSSQPTPERLAAITAMVEAGKLQVHVDKVFPFEQTAEALEYLKTGHPRGKVVIQVK
jgi:alcohol dehydrogenase